MSSTIRIRFEDKQYLESLINFIAFKTNKRLTQEEMIALLVRAGTQDKEKLLATMEAPIMQEWNWEQDPIFTIDGIQMGKDASRAIDQDIYNR